MECPGLIETGAMGPWQSEYIQATLAWHGQCSDTASGPRTGPERRRTMNIFYIIGVVVVVLAILGFLGFR